MMRIAIVNESRGTTLAAAEHARGPWKRLVGLMGRAVFPAGSGLILAPCTGLHTCFVRFPIDLVYLRLDRASPTDGHVAGLRAGLRPFRIAPVCADLVVELPAGTIARTATAIGDRITARPLADGRRRRHAEARWRAHCSRGLPDRGCRRVLVDRLDCRNCARRWSSRIVLSTALPPTGAAVSAT